MNADTERELFTRSSWSNPEESLTQMDFIMTKMRYTMTNAANLRGWVPDDTWHDAAVASLTDWKSWNKFAPLLVETAKAHRKMDSKEMSVKQVDISNDQS